MIENAEEYSENQTDTEPIVDTEEVQVQPVISNRKWTALGCILALLSSLVYTFNGLLIKKFNLDFVDTIFVRSVVQIPVLIIFLTVRKKNLTLEFPQDASHSEKVKKYKILITQVCTYCIHNLISNNRLL